MEGTGGLFGVQIIVPLFDESGCVSPANDVDCYA